jgi:hypothetical protein
MIKNILTSLIITTVVSLAGGTLISYLIDYDITKSVITLFVLQIIFFYIWNSVSQSILTFKLEQEQTKQAEYFSQQGLEASCAHCNSVNFVPIRMDQDNEFDCENCGKPNSVYIDVVVAQKAQLLDKQQLSVSSYIKDKLDATERLQQEQ